MSKKIFNYFVMLAVALFSVCAISSCGKDNDDDEPGGSGSGKGIVGTWMGVRDKGWEKEDGKITDRWDDDLTTDGMFIEFKSDGTASNSEDPYTPAKWSLKGEKLTLTYYEDGEIEKETVTCKIKGDTMTIIASEKEKYDGVTYEYYSETTFKRVKLL